MSKLALVMVARGESELVERALRSAHPFVDEMVVYDLGSGEAAVERYVEAGARVVAGRWSDDAAACRNAALDAAGAEWSLVLDPEEWLSTGADDLRDFTTAAPDHVGLVEVRRAPGGVHEMDHPRFLAPRLLPRGVRYEGAHREEAVFDLPAQRTGLVIVSDDEETGRWRADRARNEALLLQALAVRPHDASLLLRMADELRIGGRHAEAAEYYTGALDASQPTDERRHAIVIGALESFAKAGMFRQALALVDGAGSTWPHSPDFTFLLGDLFFEMLLMTPDLGPQLAPLVEMAWRRCLELGERPDLAGSVYGRGSFLAAQNLYVLYLVLGRNEEAEEWSARAGAMRMPTSAGGGLHA